MLIDKWIAVITEKRDMNPEKRREEDLLGEAIHNSKKSLKWINDLEKDYETAYRQALRREGLMEGSRQAGEQQDIVVRTYLSCLNAARSRISQKTRYFRPPQEYNRRSTAKNQENTPWHTTPRRRSRRRESG